MSTDKAKGFGFYIAQFRRDPSIAQQALRCSGFTVEKQDVFLEVFAETFNNRSAAQAAETTERTVQLWRRFNPEFLALYEDAFERGYCDLKAKAIALALHGARRTSMIVKHDDNRIETTSCSDQPGHVMRVLEMQQVEAAAIRAALVEAQQAAVPDRAVPLIDRLLSELERIEAASPEASARGESDGDGG